MIIIIPNVAKYEMIVGCPLQSADYEGAASGDEI